jgi:hypothetical protein
VDALAAGETHPRHPFGLRLCLASGIADGGGVLRSHPSGGDRHKCRHFAAILPNRDAALGASKFKEIQHFRRYAENPAPAGTASLRGAFPMSQN